MPHEFRGAPAVSGKTVPDTFVDDVTGFDLINGTLRLDLAVFSGTDPIPPCPRQIAVIGRIIMPVETAQRLCLGLYDLLRKMGLPPEKLVSGDKTAQ